MRIGEMRGKEMVMEEQTEAEKNVNKTINHSKDTIITRDTMATNKTNRTQTNITIDNNNKVRA